MPNAMTQRHLNAHRLSLMNNHKKSFNAEELFDSLSQNEQETIVTELKKREERRDTERYKKLEIAEQCVSNLTLELESIKEEIKKIDEFLFSIKKGGEYNSDEDVIIHKNAIPDLYFKRKQIEQKLLPEANDKLDLVVSEIERLEAREPEFKNQDLEDLLTPILEQRKREDARHRAAEHKEKERKQEKARRETLDRQVEKEDRPLKLSELVLSRGIKHLLHFTPVDNLKSILSKGILSRRKLGFSDFIATDRERLDNWRDWISTSVSFPNYSMLYKKTLHLSNVKGWVIIVISSSVIWELDCMFFPTNAASGTARNRNEERWKSVRAFNEMFGHRHHRQEIPDNFTTDPQAEIMIKNEIPVTYIKGVCVKTRFQHEQLKSMTNLPVAEIPRLFRPRSDHDYWKNSGHKIQPYID